MQDRDSQAIIVLGSGLSVRNRTVMPSYDQEVRLTAGVELARRSSEVPLMVLCGGQVFQGYGPISAYAQRYVIDNFGIPRESTFLVANSLNTVDDVRGAQRALEERVVGFGVVISSEGHLVAAEMAQRLGYEFIGAEGILADVPAYRQAIRELRADPGAENFLISQQRTLWILRLFGETGYRILGNLRKRNARVEISDSPSFFEKTNNLGFR